MTPERHFLDGIPYYCAVCGLGYEEYLACEERYCTLETEDKAKKRRKNYQAGMKRKKIKNEK